VASIPRAIYYPWRAGAKRPRPKLEFPVAACDSARAPRVDVQVIVSFIVHLSRLDACSAWYTLVALKTRCVAARCVALRAGVFISFVREHRLWYSACSIRFPLLYSTWTFRVYARDANAFVNARERAALITQCHQSAKWWCWRRENYFFLKKIVSWLMCGRLHTSAVSTNKLWSMSIIKLFSLTHR